MMTTEISIVEQVQRYPCIYDTGVPDYNRPDVTNEAWGNVAQTLQLAVHECKEKWRNIRSSYVRSLKRSKRSYYLAPYMKFLIPFLKNSNRGAVEEILFNDAVDDQADQNNESANDSDKSEHGIISVKLEADPIVSDAEIYNDAIEDDDDDIVNDKDFNINIRSRKRKKSKLETALTQGRKSLKRNINMKRRFQTALQSSIPKSDAQSITDLNAMRFFLLSLLPEFKTMNEEQIRLFKIKVMMLIDEVKGNTGNVRESLRSTTQNERLQKRLINLLVKNLEKQANTEDDSD